MHAFDPVRFLTLAGHLSRRIDQASSRSAISRAYYALFLQCRHWAQLEQFRGADVHRHTQAQMEAHGHTALARALRHLRHLRNAADYQREVFISPAQACASVRKAQAGLQALTVP